MKCSRCNEETENLDFLIGGFVRRFCDKCHDAVFGNPEREAYINRKIELLSLIHKTTSLMKNDELEDVLLYMKNLCLSFISSPLKDFKKG